MNATAASKQATEKFRWRTVTTKENLSRYWYTENNIKWRLCQPAPRNTSKNQISSKYIWILGKVLTAQRPTGWRLVGRKAYENIVLTKSIRFSRKLSMIFVVVRWLNFLARPKMNAGVGRRMNPTIIFPKHFLVSLGDQPVWCPMNPISEFLRPVVRHCNIIRPLATVKFLVRLFNYTQTNTCGRFLKKRPIKNRNECVKRMKLVIFDET